MKRTVSLGVIVAVLITAAVCVFPVTALVVPSGTATASATGEKPYVTATVSPASVPAGTPVTISGVSTGSAPTAQIWVFAGNYVNVSTVPVNADGTYSKTVSTENLPATTYYVFVQNPGSDKQLQITVSGFSGEVVNAATGAIIFNFTGTGSVQGDAAAVALSDALTAQGVDDIYTKTQFTVTSSASAAATTGMLVGGDRDAHGCIGSAGYTWCEEKQKCLREWEESCTGAAAAVPTTAKSPLPPFIVAAALVGACALAATRKMR